MVDGMNPRLGIDDEQQQIRLANGMIPLAAMLDGDPGCVLSGIKPFRGLTSRRKNSNVARRRSSSMAASVPCGFSPGSRSWSAGALMAAV